MQLLLLARRHIVVVVYDTGGGLALRRSARQSARFSCMSPRGGADALSRLDGVYVLVRLFLWVHTSSLV